ncbi:MAG: hypothetical protein FWG50_04870 [Kiritimatiellaeota bacterium]|nr:hypothetical protein [Kiritimatiellota bacterium]
MRTLVFSSLFVFALISRLAAAGDAPAPKQIWTAAQITNVLREVEASWEESPRLCNGKVNPICQLYSHADPHALKTLLEGISKLPVPLAEMGVEVETRRNQLLFKWKMLEELARFTPLCNDSDAWEHLASMVGWVRAQIIPDYQPQAADPLPFILDPNNPEHQDRIRDRRQKRVMDQCQHLMPSIVWQWNTLVDRIRRLADKMPPGERERFLGRIKDLARSDAEEARRLDAPVVPEKLKYPPVDSYRYFLSKSSPEQREKAIEKARRESNYTEEQLRVLEAPYDAPVPSPPAIVHDQLTYPPAAMMRKILSRSSPERRAQRLEEIRKESVYSEEDMKLLEAPYE